MTKSNMYLTATALLKLMTLKQVTISLYRLGVSISGVGYDTEVIAPRLIT